MANDELSEDGEDAVLGLYNLIYAMNILNQNKV